MTATSHQLAAARRYRIERYLTEGGMGAIYIGKKLGAGGFEKEVVLKQLLPEYTSRPEFLDLFLREAKISATLDHANIVHTFDLVEPDESLFIVMEYVRGTDLRTLVRRAKLRRRELAPGRRAAHHARGARRPRLRAHAQEHRGRAADDHPSRRVAVEHPLLGAGRGEAVRLRHRQGGDALVAVLSRARQGRVHVARAGAQRADRSPHRPLLARRLPLRGADRRAPVRRRSEHARRRALRPADRAAVAEAQDPAARARRRAGDARWRRSPRTATRTRSRSRKRCARSRIATGWGSPRLSWPSTCATSSAATPSNGSATTRLDRPAIRRRRRSRRSWRARKRSQ